MSHEFEEKAERLSFDLRVGHTNEAANVIREELRCNPQETLALIRAADQMNRGRSMDHVVVRGDGDILITDPRQRRAEFVGQLPPCIQDRDDNYYRGQQVPRYGDRGGCFGNGGYEPRPPVIIDRYPDDRYNRPPVIVDRYPGDGYPSDNGNLGTGIAIGVIGGLILDNALNHHGRNDHRDDHRNDRHRR